MAETDTKIIPLTRTSRSAEVQQQIAGFKGEIDELLSRESVPPSQLDEVLSYLQYAEKLADDNNPKAWYELARARLILRQNKTFSTLEFVEGDTHLLRREIYKVWLELNRVQCEKLHINTTNAADWLKWGEEALDETKPRKPRAMYCIMRARYSLAKAQEFADWARYGYLAIFIESLYLLFPLSIYIYAARTNIPIADIMTGSMLQVPFYVFVWGFLGGISWCIYSAAYWSKRRLFDRHYLAWYLAHPWISAVLGGAVSLLIFGGINSLAKFDPKAPPGSSALSIVSFVAGFSTNAIWKLIDRNVRKRLGNEGSTRNIHEETHEDILKSAE